MRRQTSAGLVGILVVLLALAGPAKAEEPIIKVTNHDGIWLEFTPLVQDYSKVILTVTGPCNYIRRDVIPPETQDDDEILSFELDHRTIDDGISDGERVDPAGYTFSVVVIPQIDQGVKDILEENREKADQGDPKATDAINALCRAGKLPDPRDDPAFLSQSFMVRDQKIIYDPDYQEDHKTLNADVFAESVPMTTMPGAKGGATYKDFVINDDLIVDGSACIGFDCVNGESFGFDTIRVKENNLRIKFDDTSTAASFPRNDWQLTANDSANGGASKFSIDDISGSRTPFTVEANARSHSLYVDDGGRIGSRTSTPSTEIHTIDGDTPTLRLQQDGSSGFAPQTWDVAGNETNFFIRDVTNGSQLPFRIRPDAPTSSIDIDADGNVGLGTSSPDRPLDIEEDGPGFRLTNTGSAGGVWDWKMNGSTGRMNVTDDTTASRVPFKIEPGADNNLLRIGVVASDQVDIDGDLVVTGTITPDYVFDPGFQLESIEEHASFMWRERHLPAVAPATTDENGKHLINVGSRAQGMLEELEMAHVYIDQLHTTITELKQAQQQLERRLEELENK